MPTFDGEQSYPDVNQDYKYLYGEVVERVRSVVAGFTDDQAEAAIQTIVDGIDEIVTERELTIAYPS